VTRLYRLLLRALPGSFRREYGAELCEILELNLAGKRGLAQVGVWLGALGDLARTAARLHADALRQDAAWTRRSLARSPGFTAAAVLVMGLGIGANAAVFSVADRALLRPLPFPEPDRLVRLWEKLPEYSDMEASPANYRDWEDAAQSFQSMAGFHFRPYNVSVSAGAEPRRLTGSAVTADFFATLGVAPHRGRTLGPGDDVPEGPAVAVLDYGLWQELFGGAPLSTISGLRLDGVPYEVVGVMPPDFHFPSRQARLWTPRRFVEEEFEDRDDNYVDVVARLAPGVSADEARAELDVLARRLEAAHPVSNADTGITMRALRDVTPTRSRQIVLALAGAALVVLLIACSNLASLQLARAVARRRELAVRAALGADRGRLLRQLLTEGVAIAALGGALGAVVAALSAPVLDRLVPRTLPVPDAALVDPRVLGFTAAVTLLTGLAFSLAPALRSARADAAALQEGSRSGLGARGERFRGGLVSAQVAASVVLLVVAGLLIRALWKVQAVDPGFDTANVVAVQTPLAIDEWSETSRRAELYERILSRVRGLPGVEGAAYASYLPLDFGGGVLPVSVPGSDLPEDRELRASLRYVTPGYFDAMGIPLLLGRDVSGADTMETPLVAVVSESFAERYWPGQNPLGRPFDFAFDGRIVAGVVADVRVRGLERSSEPQVYLPYRQARDGWLNFYYPKELVVRTAGERAPLLSAVREIVRENAPGVPVAAARSLAEVVSEDTEPRRLQLRVLAAFAGLALVLAGLGLHGLLAFSVASRRSEIGLRMALGARGGEVLRLVVGRAARLTAVGASIGLLASWGAARAIEALLAGVPPADPASFAAALAVAAVTALSGSLLPSLEAVRVDPTEAIRGE
jgi:putative ABC transport system permease protein